MKLKHLFVVSLILIILTVGAASASEDIAVSQDVADDVLGDIDDGTVLNNENNPDTLQNDESQMDDLNENLVDENTLNAPYHINGGTFKDIQDVIDTCDEDSVIELEGVFNSTGTAIKIEKNLEIRGSPGTILDAKGFNGIISFKGIKNCNISGITFINAKPDADGFALGYVIDQAYGCSGNYSIINCTFKNNNVASIISLQRENTTCQISYCNFSDNVGSIPVQGNISNCNFERMSNGHIGLASFVSDSNFTKNTDFEIYYPNTVINCKFTNNTSLQYGKHLINTAQSVIGCNFIDNTGIGYGIIYQINLVKNCNFENDVLKRFDDLASEGGAIFNAVTVDSCNFTKCRANYGGALSNVDSVTNCNFKDNVADIGAGAIYGVRYLSKSSFVNNRDGAVLIQSPDSFSVIGCDFIGNSGTALSVDVNGQIKDCTFTNNKEEDSGSAIYIYATSNPVKIAISNTKFSNNVANGNFYPYGYDFKNYGNGAIYVLGNYPHKLTFNNCQGIGKNTDKFKINIKKINVAKSVKYQNYLVFTFKDQFSGVVKGEKISVKIGGTTYNKVTDKVGQIKILITAPAKLYSVKISNAGSNHVAKFSKTVKVNVKKATPKFSATKLKFKSTLKTKKLTVTLKDKKAVKKAKLSLKINGKKYTAKTSSKGKATFKITKLSKKGTYSAKVKFAGNDYYNKCSKTLKITVN